MANNVYMGAREARALVGRFHSLVGSDVQIQRPIVPQPQYGGYGGGWPFHHHHHHHPQWGGWNGYGYAQPAYPQYPQPVVRDHRRGAGLPFVGADPNAILAAAQAFGIPPRAALVEAPAPTMANRQVLPMNTGGQSVGPGLTAIITSRPQRVAFRPERVFVSATGTSTQGAAAWLVNDITIGNRSQYVQQGALPGDMFATGAIDSFITFETAQTAMDVTMSVTFNDPTVSEGQPFYGSLIGTAAMNAM